MTEFEFRTLAREPYQEVVVALGLIAGGDTGALADLSARARSALEDPDLGRRNARSGQLRLWRDWLDTQPAPGAATADKLGELAVAVLCMPGFQTSPLAGDEPSPHLVLLGDSDGGLFGVLAAHVAWFEPWLSDSLANQAERYGYGRNMFCLSPEALTRFSVSLALEAECKNARLPEHCRAALARLSALVASARSGAGLTLAVSETG